MSNPFQDRLAALSPEQRALMEKRLQEKGLASKVLTQEKEGVPEEALRKIASQLVQKRAAAHPGRVRRTDKGMEFSLFFFSGDGSTEGADKYRLLMDSAKFADEHGYTAVWTPERHFEDFGGLYPNPSVLSAALAATTKQLQIRAGSVVLPLHHPIRLIEEWSVVDNLSNGRVGVAFASGWHPADYALAPESTWEAYQSRKERMLTTIPRIRELWAGDEEQFTGIDGKEHIIRILPRPIQPQLPIWIATNGNLETFLQAASVGAHILTGLPNQSIDELEEKIRRYREALAQHGYDPEAGQVTVMMHTCLGPTDEGVKELVRRPMIDYLQTFVKQHRTIQEQFESFSDNDREVLVSYAFETYFEDTALFGSVDKCAGQIETLIDIGVSEVACLIDFGVDYDNVLASLTMLNELKDRYAGGGNAQ